MNDVSAIRSLVSQLTRALESARELLRDTAENVSAVASDGPRPSDASATRDRNESPAPLDETELLREVQFLRSRVAELARRTAREVVMHASVDAASPEGRVQINWPEQLLAVSDDVPAVLAAAAGSDKRIGILKLLYSHSASSAQLGEAVGLRGGALFHHLSALLSADLVRQPGRNDYTITDRGRDVLLTLLLLSKRTDTGVRA